MKKLRWIYFVFVLAALTSCGGGGSSKEKSKEKSKPVVEQKTATEEVKEEKVVEGGALNTYFPKASGEFSLTFTQEKDGFAQADLKKGSTTIGTLAISDTDNNSSAVEKFKKSSEKLDGYPLVKSGGKGTAILVGDKYQVQARSTDKSFTEDMRKEWIKKFDLKGLSKLKK